MFASDGWRESGDANAVDASSAIYIASDLAAAAIVRIALRVDTKALTQVETQHFAADVDFDTGALSADAANRAGDTAPATIPGVDVAVGTDPTAVGEPLSGAVEIVEHEAAAFGARLIIVTDDAAAAAVSGVLLNVDADAATIAEALDQAMIKAALHEANAAGAAEVAGRAAATGILGARGRNPARSNEPAEHTADNPSQCSTTRGALGQRHGPTIDGPLVHG
jgi:hypothetical protein